MGVRWGGILTHIKKYVRDWNNRNNNMAHGIALTGFDKEKKVFYLANSWGDAKSERMIRFEDLYKVYANITFVEGVTVFKK